MLQPIAGDDRSGASRAVFAMDENRWWRRFDQRLVDAVTTPLLLRTVMAGKLKPKQLITHHFKLDEIIKAYDTFGNAGKERALKVILTNP